MKLKSVEFVKQWGSYNKGDVAGFDPEKADNLIKAKVAKAYKAPAKTKQDA